MTTYRYLFADLVSNQILAELPLRAVNFTQTLNAAGTLSASLLITDSTEQTTNIINSTVPSRTAVYVDRNGVIVWGGVLWARDYNSATQSMNFTAREFESYFERRRVNYTQAFSGVDQLTIAQSLINTAQSQTGGNIGVAVGTETSGVTVSRVFHAYEQKTVLAAIQELSHSSTGFDFAIVAAYDANNNPSKKLKLGYPKLGTRYNPASVSAPVFEFPGNLVEYDYSEDGSLTANVFSAIGAGSNEGQNQQTIGDSTKLTAGWPLLEDSANYTDLVNSTLLLNIATGRLNALSTPPVTLKIVAPAYAEPQLGAYSIGDDIRVRIRDDRFPNQLDAIYRLVALNVTPNEDGPTTEQVTLTLTLPTA